MRLKHFKEIKDSKTKELIGRVVKCETKKNKIAPPMRTTYFTLSWGTKPGAWLNEVETIFSVCTDSEIFKKITAQKYSFKLSSGKEIEFTRKTLQKYLEDEVIMGEIKDAIEDRFIIKSDSYSGDTEYEDPEE